MTYPQSVLFALSILSLTILWIAYGSILTRLARRPTRSAERLFPVTVLKPLKGVDEGLADNLRAIFSQQHPDFEVIVGCEDPHDPALSVARRVADEFPERRIVVASGGGGRGMNPKVRLLRRLMQFAQHDWILISDSNVRPDPDYLTAMQLRQLETGADLVHSILSGVDGRSLGGRLEELQLNGWVAASICMIDFAGRPCVIGKSMLLRRSALTKVGGFDEVQDVLAEDYILGHKLRQSGRVVALSSHRLPVVTGRAPLHHFFNRHVRWGQMRRRISPFFFVAELTANPTPFLLGLALVSDAHLRVWALAAQLVKWIVDALIYLRLARSPCFPTLALIPVKDLLVSVMWLVSALRRTVAWRGHRMLVGPGSRLMPLEDRQQPRHTWSRLRRVI